MSEMRRNPNRSRTTDISKCLKLTILGCDLAKEAEVHLYLSHCRNPAAEGDGSLVTTFSLDETIETDTHLC